MSSDRIRVRMYHVGFGDCILVTFPPDDRHLLIDCGVHFEDDISAVPRVVEYIGEHTGGDLSVVVGTHRHCDHLSGFDSDKDRFRQMQTHEVWLPYFLEPSHPALRAWDRHHKRLMNVLSARAQGARSDKYSKLQNQLEAFEFSNKRSLQTLTGKWADYAPKPRWLSADSSLHDSPALPGVGVQVLGPHTDNPWIRQDEYK